MHILTSLDRNPIQIGTKTTHTTILGSIIGLLVILVLGFLAIDKILSVIHRDILYLNNWSSQQSWDVYLDDIEFKFAFQASIINSSENIRNLTQYVLQNRQSFIELTHQNLHQIGFKAQAVIHQIHFQNQTQQNYDLVPCQDNKKYLCIPSNLNIALSENCLIQLPRFDMKQAWVRIFRVNNQNRQENIRRILGNNGQEQEKSILLVINTLFTDKKINPKLINPRYSTPTIANQYFAMINYNITKKINYKIYFSSYNVSTDWNIFPTFFGNQKQLKIYWKHENKLDTNSQIQYAGNDFNFQFDFKRALISNVYERSYKKIDSVFAQILGISAIIGVFLYFIFGNYAKWSSQKYLLSQARKICRKKSQQQQDNEQESEQEELQVSDYYLKHLKQNLCGKKQKKQAQKTIISKIIQCGNLSHQYQQTKILQQLNIKLKVLQSVLYKDLNLKKKYQQELLLKMRQQEEKKGKVMDQVNQTQNLSQSLIS